MFLDTIELLFTATYVAREHKQPILAKASAKLDLLKFFLQIAWEIKALNANKYTALSESLNEIGRMLGGWIRSTKER